MPTYKIESGNLKVKISTAFEAEAAEKANIKIDFIALANEAVKIVTFQSKGNCYDGICNIAKGDLNIKTKIPKSSQKK